MNIKILREKGWIIFEAVSGSNAYGTNVEGSDIDIRGVYIQPTEEMLGLNNYVPHVSDDKNDTTFYEIGTFLELAAKGNPNIMELFNMPEDCIIYKSPIWDELFTPEVCKKFITTRLKYSFTGFAVAQIKKARGMNKKIAWEQNKVTRKDVLDFCYVITGKEESVKFKDWVSNRYNFGDHDFGLAKVNNVPDLYSIYLLHECGGIISEDSNDVQVRNIPKDAPFISYLRFDKNA